MTTTTDTPRPLYAVNADPADVATGAALMSLIVAAAERRAHLRGSIISIQWDADRGIGVLVKDAGQRQHLANAISLPATITDFAVRGVGTGSRRTGEIEGVAVTVWNIEP